MLAETDEDAEWGLVVGCVGGGGRGGRVRIVPSGAMMRMGACGSGPWERGTRGPPSP